jgi:hypothetical protein
MRSRRAASLPVNLRTEAARAVDGGVISAIEYEVVLHLERPSV